MKIAICSSMVFTEEMLKIKKDLENLGYTVFVSSFAEKYLGMTSPGWQF